MHTEHTGDATVGYPAVLNTCSTEKDDSHVENANGIAYFLKRQLNYGQHIQKISAWWKLV